MLVRGYIPMSPQYISYRSTAFLVYFCVVFLGVYRTRGKIHNIYSFMILWSFYAPQLSNIPLVSVINFTDTVITHLMSSQILIIIFRPRSYYLYFLT